RLANARAAGALAFDIDRVHRLDFKSVLFAQLLQQREIAGAVAAETLVVANHDIFGAEPVAKHIAHEIVGFHFAETGVERDAQHAINTEIAQRHEFLVKTHQPRRRVSWREKFARQRLETDHRRRQAQLAAFLLQARQHHLVTAMDAIECPLRHHTAVVAGAQIVQSSDQFHRGFNTALSRKQGVRKRAIIPQPRRPQAAAAYTAGPRKCLVRKPKPTISPAYSAKPAAHNPPST